MATILLGAIGTAAGGALGGSALGISAAVIGRALGSTLGRVIDQKLLGGGSEVVETGRMDRLRVLGASEGGAIPSVFGRMRVAGNVIWTSNFRETTSTTQQGGKGAPKGPKIKSYSYSVHLAVALGEGGISRVGRIWADGQIISKSDINLRVYRGTDNQLPDPIISAIEGADNTPAYRGTAYVVFEDLDLGQFGNRVPQLSFEVVRPANPNERPGPASMSDLVQGVALIPGTGEYALATSPIYRDAGAGLEASNINSAEGIPDIQASLQMLDEELPNCNAVSLIVSWFGDDLRVGHCRVQPKVEHAQNFKTSFGSEERSAGVDKGWANDEDETYPWVVSGISRPEAQVISQIDGRPIYGGTPSDGSIIEVLQALEDQGKAVNFYPFLLMEVLPKNNLPNPWDVNASGQDAFPWRGRITTEKAPGVEGSTDRTATARAEVASFFGTAAASDFHINGKTVEYSGPNESSYRRFILHYAALCKAAGNVASFCIGSEMRSLTQIRDETGAFPAVSALVNLAADVRSILGGGVMIGYAADWSEYFGYRPDDGSGDLFFHLDPLWADPNIDFVGIDNYMPISDWRDGDEHLDADAGSIYDLDYLRANIEGGEGFDWYYASDQDRVDQLRTPITDDGYGEPWVYRYKDIRSWWSQPHHNRIAGVRQPLPTDWVPQSKPVWFTELGCAAINKATNQPNKFLDPKSSESAPPYFSDGRRDDYIQMQYLRAYFDHFGEPSNNPVSSVYGGEMVDLSRAYVWAWDGRPWPDFPNNTALWNDGPNHAHGHWLNGRTGVQSLADVVGTICELSGIFQYDTTDLHGVVRGYSVSDVQTARSTLQPLMVTFGFDAIETNGVMVFRSREIARDVEIDGGSFVVVDEEDAVIEHIRAPEAELVGQVRLGYVEAEGEFVPRIADARFPGDNTPVSSQNDLPLALISSEARSVTERWLSEARIARDTVRFSLPPSCCEFAVGDMLRISDASDDKLLWRIDRIETGSARAIEAVRVEKQVYHPSQSVEELSEVRPYSTPLPLDVQFLDLPLLTGNEKPVAPYVAVSASPWSSGAAVYGSSEDSDYGLNTVVENAAIMGVTLNSLGQGIVGVWDRGPKLTVKLSSGALSSATKTRVLNGANVCAIGDGSIGNWEIFQFATAELVAPYTYDLSTRLRGQAGTEAIISNVWPGGSRFVLLDQAPSQIEFDAASRQLDRHYRIGPITKSYTDPVFRHFIENVQGVGLRPYAPAHLKLCRVGDDFKVSWIRRTRIDGDSWAGLNVPLGEDFEQYILRVTSSGTVIREVILSDPNWTYSSEMRATDGPTDTVEVAQISQSFGAGLFTRKSLDV